MQFLIIIGLVVFILFGMSQCNGEPENEQTTSSVSTDLEFDRTEFAGAEENSILTGTQPTRYIAQLPTEQIIEDSHPLEGVYENECGGNAAKTVEDMLGTWHKTQHEDLRKAYAETETGRRIIQQGASNSQPLSPRASLSIVRNQQFQRAKSNIIRSLFLEMNAFGYASKRPSGFTMGNEIDIMAEDLKREEEEIYEQAKQLDKEIEQLSDAVDAANLDELSGTTITDRVDSLLTSATKNLDATYNLAQDSAQEKARVDELRTRLNAMQEDRRALAERESTLQKAIEVIQDEIKSGNEVEMFSLYPLYGAIVLKQAHCYNPIERKYAVAVKMIWSDTLQEEAEASLLGSSDYINPKPGEESAASYFDDIETGQPTVGRYIDDKGVPYFYAIRLRDYNGEDIFGVDEGNEALARGDLALALFSDARAFTKVREEMSTFDTLKETLTLADLEIALSQEVERLPLRGSQVRSFFADDPYSNQDYRVALAYVDMNLAREAPQIMAQISAAKERVLRNQSYIKAFVQGLRDRAESARNDPAAARQGRRDAFGKVDDIQRDSERPTGTPTSSSNRRIENTGAFESDDVVDDF